MDAGCQWATKLLSTDSMTTEVAAEWLANATRAKKLGPVSPSKEWSRREDLNFRPADYEEAKKGHQRPRKGIIPFPYRRIG